MGEGHRLHAGLGSWVPRPAFGPSPPAACGPTEAWVVRTVENGEEPTMMLDERETDDRVKVSVDTGHETLDVTWPWPQVRIPCSMARLDGCRGKFAPGRPCE